CACAVPMAMSLEGIKNVAEAARSSGKNYMMMETALYTYQFFYVKQMLESGVLGRIQFMRGSHYQDMIAYPDYWMGLPPMLYSTHAIAPMAALYGSRIERVHCLGSGTMEPWLHEQYGNPYPVESALLSFENGMKAEATRSMFEVAKIIQEGLYVYGSKASFEWGVRYFDDPYVTAAAGNYQKMTLIEFNQIATPNCADKLPESIRRFTAGEGHYDPSNPQKPLTKETAAMHHGSHPHLVHEFIMSIVENRKPGYDEVFAANITASGICAHESAMKDGEAVVIPTFK
ncbi:MAG: gfo/Idh/MocA family oxidoreductase, partial [Defluviitaleaceae bacterium]|nr:gfo/Idh/MocA family oxidoreductase [Defluviitaleaceae bacterium]